MNKKERNNVLKKLKPQTWYLFCVVEASHDSEVEISKAKLAAELGISLPTLAKYIASWESLGLIREISGGFCITQIDGEPSGITGEVVERKFKKAKDIIDLWCDVYLEVYEEHYTVNNWAMAQKQVKKLLTYSDTEIEGGVIAAVKFYSTKWINPKYTRPTLGALSSWLFQQALPYADKSQKVESVENTENLLNDLESKGWI